MINDMVVLRSNIASSIFLIIFLFCALNAYAADIGVNVIMNTSASNTSMTFSSVSISGDVDVYSNAIILKNLSYTNNELELNATMTLNFSDENNNVDSSELPYLLSSSTQRMKYIDSNISQTINATILVSTNCTNITGISYASPNYTAAYASWSCSSNRLLLDIIGIEPGSRNVLTISSNDTLAPSLPPGSIGGGGERVAGGAAVIDFTVEPKMISIGLKQGEIKTYDLLITNIGDTGLSLVFDAGKLSNHVKAFEETIPVEPNESRKFTLVFSSSIKDEPDVIVGNIFFKSDFVTRAVPVILEISSIEPLFDAKLKIPDDYKEVSPGSNVLANITIINLGDILKVDVEIEYLIKDMQDNVVDHTRETLAIEKELQFTKNLSVPKDLTGGDYVYYARVNYAGKTAVASDYFKVRLKSPELPIELEAGYVTKILIIGILALALFVILAYVARKLREHEIAKKPKKRKRIKKAKKKRKQR